MPCHKPSLDQPSWRDTALIALAKGTGANNVKLKELASWASCKCVRLLTISSCNHAVIVVYASFALPSPWHKFLGCTCNFQSRMVKASWACSKGSSKALSSARKRLQSTKCKPMSGSSSICGTLPPYGPAVPFKHWKKGSGGWLISRNKTVSLCERNVLFFLYVFLLVQYVFLRGCHFLFFWALSLTGHSTSKDFFSPRIFVIVNKMSVLQCFQLASCKSFAALLVDQLAIVRLE